MNITEPTETASPTNKKRKQQDEDAVSVIDSEVSWMQEIDEEACGHDIVWDLVEEDPFLKHSTRKLTDEETAELLVGPISYYSSPQVLWPNVGMETTEAERLLSEMQPYLSDRMCHAWIRLHTDRGEPLMSHGFVSEAQKSLFSLVSSYKNLLYPMRRLPSKVSGFKEDEVLDVVVAHCVDHVLRCKSRLQDQISQRKEKPKKKPPKKKIKKKQLRLEDDDEDRVLGFAQPKVLFLVPMRNKAYNVLERIASLGPPSSQQGMEVVMEKLKTNYGPDDVLEAVFKQQKKNEGKKPIDHEAMFYGHVADSVKTGIKIHLNGNFSFFRPLKESDIIVASPISLAIAIEKNEQQMMDCLSSIEILVVDWMDVILMQNWRHLQTVLTHLNRLPTQPTGNIHFTQIRQYFLQGQGQHFRQTLLFSSFLTAEMNSMFHGPLCSNHSGKVRFRPEYNGVLSNITKKVIHRIQRFPCHEITELPECRLQYFSTKIIPEIRGSTNHGILIFVSHFFDFEQVCELLMKEEINFGAISEYTGKTKTSETRYQFKHQETRVLVLTERAYFYHRPAIQGIKELMFYSLPEHAHYYNELVQSTECEQSNVRVLSLYSARFCIFQLERIIGTEKTLELLEDVGTFVSVM